MTFQIVRCSPNLSTLIAISNHFWIFKLCVFRQFFLHSSQLICHLIIFELSNCVLFAKSFHIHCNWLIIQSFVFFQMKRCSPNLYTFIASNLSFNYLWIFKVCVFCQIFPHSSQLTCHPIISEFSNVALPSNYSWIFKLCAVCQIFPHSLQLTYHRIICEFSNCAFFTNISTIIALDLSSNHSCILKLCVVRQMFPHSMQITRHQIIYVFSNEALFAKPFQTHHEAGQRPILSKESKN